MPPGSVRSRVLILATSSALAGTLVWFVARQQSQNRATTTAHLVQPAGGPALQPEQISQEPQPQAPGDLSSVAAPAPVSSAGRADPAPTAAAPSPSVLASLAEPTAVAAPGPNASAAPARAPSAEFHLPGVAPSPFTGLLRRALTPEEIARFQPHMGPMVQAHPLCLYHYKAGIENVMRFDEHPRRRVHRRTNAHGLRNAREVLAQHPDLRVLVVGDSHTDGVCDPDETFASRLERKLAAQRADWSVESLNAGCGGYSFYHHLGTLERFLPAQPDVFVVCVFGGNDFIEPLLVRAAFEWLPSPGSHAAFAPQLERAASASKGAVYQGLSAVKYLQTFPAEVENCFETARNLTREMVAVCRANGVAPVFVYLPPAHDVQWERYSEALSRTAELLELDPAASRAVLDELAERYLALLVESGVTVLDLRPMFRAADKPLYWSSDLHINLDAHELIAQELAPLVLAAAPEVSKHRGAPLSVLADSKPLVGPMSAFVDVQNDPLPSFAHLDAAAVGRWAPLGDDVRFHPETLLEVARRTEFTPQAPSQRRIAILADEIVWPLFEEATGLGQFVGEALENAGRPAQVREHLTAGGGVQTALLQARQAELSDAEVLVVVINTNNDFVESYELSQLAKGELDPALGPAQGSPFSAQRQWLRSARMLRDNAKPNRDMARTTARALFELAAECAARNQTLVVAFAPGHFNDACEGLRKAVEARAAEETLQPTHCAATHVTAVGLQSLALLHDIRWVQLPASRDSDCLQDPQSFRLNSAGRSALARAIADEILRTR
jgi:lysophospholipase L1-like esterase